MTTTATRRAGADWAPAPAPAVVRVRPWDVRKGDRILGTSMVANGPAKYAGYADAVEQQRYSLAVTHADGRVGQITYSALSWVPVLREEEEPNGTQR